ncbi:MAG: universal stress protein [Pseudomonadota bacterium]
MRSQRVLAVLGEDETALRTAAALAERHGAALLALATVEPPHDLAIAARIAGQAPEALLNALAERCRADAREALAHAALDREVTLEIRVGKAFIEIIRFAIERDCDFVVKAAEPLSGINRFLFASTDQHLLRKCPCAIWLQTGGAAPAPRRVLATVDLDTWDAAEPETLGDLNRRVIDAARSIAAPRGAEIVVLHAWEALGEGMVWAFSGGQDARVSAETYVNEIVDTRHRAMHQLLAEAAPCSGLTLIPRLARGTPEAAICETARALEADVVVMGTVARTGLAGVFIGNTAENIINTLTCPVLAVKPRDFVSPLDPITH